jgi:hypothetical protein
VKNQICNEKNSNGVKENFEKFKYEITTDLPSARARLFFGVLTNWCPILDK